MDIIITNPPIGGMEEDRMENNFPRKYQTRETAELMQEYQEITRQLAEAQSALKAELIAALEDKV